MGEEEEGEGRDKLKPEKWVAEFLVAFALVWVGGVAFLITQTTFSFSVCVLSKK